MPYRKTACTLLPVLGLVVAVGCGGGDRIPTGGVTGTITVNGEPVEGLIVRFVPEGKVRPAAGRTDAAGYYEAQLLADQSGVPQGKCRIEFGLYKGDGTRNFLEPFNEARGEDLELNPTITSESRVFDYDIQYDGELP